ncbi:hypothetical protein [uncultured Dysosmobacter sp.]|uniref:hypothetical protein n=1 Tax=uncultured Dysosmobacter sp. TaxID=2591384 RepID=UPI002607452D|nr:hypothetical protein [uncultured Dysosmobacter sp.]
MAKNNNTPVSFWLSLPLPDLVAWIKASNAIVEKENAERQRARQSIKQAHRRK